MVAIAAIVIRRSLDEIPAFQKAADRQQVVKIPLSELLRDHWPNLLRVTLGGLASTVSTIFAVYALAFAVNTVGLDDTTMLWVLIVTAVVIAFTPKLSPGARPADARIRGVAGHRGLMSRGQERSTGRCDRPALMAEIVAAGDRWMLRPSPLPVYVKKARP